MQLFFWPGRVPEQEFFSGFRTHGVRKRDVTSHKKRKHLRHYKKPFKLFNRFWYKIGNFCKRHLFFRKTWRNSCGSIIFLLSLTKYAIITNNAVMCWNRPWQYGCNRPNALPSGGAFLYIGTEEIFMPVS